MAVAAEYVVVVTTQPATDAVAEYVALVISPSERAMIESLIVSEKKYPKINEIVETRENPCYGEAHERMPHIRRNGMSYSAGTTYSAMPHIRRTLVTSFSQRNVPFWP